MPDSVRSRTTAIENRSFFLYLLCSGIVVAIGCGTKQELEHQTRGINTVYWEELTQVYPGNSFFYDADTTVTITSKVWISDEYGARIETNILGDTRINMISIDKGETAYTVVRGKCYVTSPTDPNINLLSADGKIVYTVPVAAEAREGYRSSTLDKVLGFADWMSEVISEDYDECEWDTANIHGNDLPSLRCVKMRRDGGITEIWTSRDQLLKIRERVWDAKTREWIENIRFPIITNQELSDTLFAVPTECL